jgi:hypothetical protein
VVIICTACFSIGKSACLYFLSDYNSKQHTAVIRFSLSCTRTGHILRRNCLLKQAIEGKIQGEMEVTRKGGRGRKKLLDDLKDRKGYSHFKEEDLDRTTWRNRFGGGFGHVVRQNTESMNVQGLPSCEVGSQFC